MDYEGGLCGVSICRVCAAGAAWNVKWRDTNSVYTLNMANEAHGMCRGCDCQHVTGDASRRVVPDALVQAQH